MLFPPDILLPGPTPIPEAVQRAMLTSMSDHRGAAFEPVHHRVLDKLHAIFHLDPQDGAIAILPASGTGVLEAVCQNFLNPGDKVLAVTTGLFGQRFAEAAQNMECDVERLDFPWGTAFAPEKILAQVDQTAYHALLVTHNETSTGVTNPVDQLAASLGERNDAPLLLVDSISGVPSLPLFFDQPGIDVIIAASQKGFMCPPGLGLIAAGPRALERLLPDRPGRFYFNLAPYFHRHFPYTPAVSLWYGLDAALDLLLAEGESARFARHRLLGAMARRFGQVAGFTPLASAGFESPTVTSLNVPKTTNPPAVRQAAAQLGLQIAGGLGPWADSAIRIGHVGAVTPQMLFAGLSLFAHQVNQAQTALAETFAVWHQSLA